ncbi:MAG: hypothetical protein J6112_06115, partial [Clostridia bacterium]|nr:hypothetical protein [Clostridia bacterium]
GDSFYIITHMFEGLSSPLAYIKTGVLALGFDLRNVVILAFSVVLLTVFDAFSVKNDVIGYITGRKKAVRWIIYILFAVFMIICLPAAHGTEFIYFRF